MTFGRAQAAEAGRAANARDGADAFVAVGAVARAVARLLFNAHAVDLANRGDVAAIKAVAARVRRALAGPPSSSAADPRLDRFVVVGDAARAAWGLFRGDDAAPATVALAGDGARDGSADVGLAGLPRPTAPFAAPRAFGLVERAPEGGLDAAAAVHDPLAFAALYGVKIASLPVLARGGGAAASAHAARPPPWPAPVRFRRLLPPPRGAFLHAPRRTRRRGRRATTSATPTSAASSASRRAPRRPGSMN